MQVGGMLWRYCTMREGRQNMRALYSCTTLPMKCIRCTCTLGRMRIKLNAPAAQQPRQRSSNIQQSGCGLAEYLLRNIHPLLFVAGG